MKESGVVKQILNSQFHFPDISCNNLGITSALLAVCAMVEGLGDFIVSSDSHCPLFVFCEDVFVKMLMQMLVKLKSLY